MKKFPYAAAAWLFIAQSAAFAEAPPVFEQAAGGPTWTAVSALQVEAAPVRTWRAFVAELAEDRGALLQRLDDRRYEAQLALRGGEAVRVGIDWDERSGGARIAWQATSAVAQAAVAPLLTRVAARAPAEARDNHLCRGAEGDTAEAAEASLDAVPSCRYGAGEFSSALFELEKCGDYETALRILAACVAERHAGGMIRLAQFYEIGLGVPQRPERMTEYLRRAAEGGTTGYRDNARVQYATALYFGVGVAPDRAAALRLFRAAAADGDADALHFLRHGYHAAWRKLDGSLYVDRAWQASPAPGG